MRKTAVVTGGSRGIGRAVAVEMARRGYDVWITARDRGAAAETMREAAASGGGVVRFLPGDLATIAGARAVGLAILAEVPRIDVLVHNAGLWPSRLALTEDGIESAFAVNHVAPFVLNHVLEARLRNDHTRVVQVSAGLYIKGKVDVARTPTGEDFHAIRTYADTKLANLMMMPLFAKKLGTEASIVAVHPGVIRTDLGDRAGALGFVLRLVKRLWKTPAEGAAPVVRLADRTVAEASADSGRYYHELGPQELSPIATRGEAAEALWAKTAALAGASLNPPTTEDPLRERSPSQTVPR